MNDPQNIRAWSEATDQIVNDPAVTEFRDSVGQIFRALDIRFSSMAKEFAASDMITALFCELRDGGDE